MMTIKQKEFLKDLRELLIKYNAEIEWTCDECSDTFGLSGDHLYISMHGQDDIDLSGLCVDACVLGDLLRGDSNE